MRFESITFLCDHGSCDARFTTLADGDVAAHLALVDAGWQVERRKGNPRLWRHYCPDHRRDQEDS